MSPAQINDSGYSIQLYREVRECLASHRARGVLGASLSLALMFQSAVLTTILDQMSGNKIPDLTGLEKELRKIETLRTRYLEANPCQKNDMANYRRKVMLTLPQLTQIDAT